MPLNLSPLSKFLEGEMIDTCLVTYDASGYTDDEFDTESMQYFQKNGDATSLYNGKCILAPEANVPQGDAYGGAPVVETFYKMRTPMASGGFPPNSLVLCLTSVRHPGLIGVKFVVVEEVASSWGVSRVHRMTRKTVVAPGSEALLPD